MRALVLISVGNTRTRIARSTGDQIDPSRVFTNDNPEAVAAHAKELAGDSGARVLIASVNDPFADRVDAAITRSGLETSRLGRDIPIPIASSLAENSGVGADRLLAALGAFARSQQACIVIDAGTAVTIDFVDGEGTFQGGAIAPGLRLMLRALHEHTAALPDLPLSPELLPREASIGEPDPEPAPPFGKNTAQAMTVGVVSAIRGLARERIDRYAEFYGGYPRVVATGGDAPLLFQNDPLIEHIVPDLTLVGMLEAVKIIEKLDSEE